MTNIKVRLASTNDSLAIFDWRNDGLTRNMSHDSDLIEIDEHDAWFKFSLAEDSRVILICENDTQESIAMVRFDIKDDTAIVSINLNPEMRGTGLGKACLNSSIEFFTSKYSSVNTLTAEIKPDNIASHKTFAAVGFSQVYTKDNVIFYQRNLVG